MTKKGAKLNKPSEIIAMRHLNITTLMKKSYNVLLHNAFQTMKNNESDVLQTVFTVPIHVIKEQAGIKATDNKRLKDELSKMKKISVEYDLFNKVTRDYTDWMEFNLVPYIKKKGDVLEYQLPAPVCEALLNPKVYSQINLQIIKGFKSRYSVILYELIKDYVGAQIPKMTVEKFKELFGVAEDKYPNFYNLKKRVIDVAIKEVNDKTDEFFVELDTTTVGRKTTHIKFNFFTGPQMMKKMYQQELQRQAKLKG